MARHPHGALRPVGEGLHCAEGRMRRLPFERRMTVLGLPPGRLAIHSGIRMAEGDMAAPDSLRAVLAWDFERIVMGHGAIVESGGRARLRAAFAPPGL